MFPPKVTNVIYQVVDPQYIRALMEFLISDPTTTPSPDDFPDPEEGYLLWGDRIGTSIQEHLCSLLEARYLHPEGKGRKRPLPPHAGPNGAPALSEKKPVGGSGTMVDVFFKIVGGQGLLCKPGSEAHCKVEFGYLPDDTPGAPPSMPPLPGEDTIKISLGTENSPVKRQDDGGGFVVWNQHVNLPATNLTDAVMISVFEKGSGKMIGGEDVFLGRHRIAISDLITTSAKEGYVERWCELRGRPNGKKDKSVGGEVLVEFTIHHDDKETQKPSASAPSNMDPELPLRRLQSATTILSPPLYRVLMRAAVECDLHNRPPLLVTPPPPNRRGGATGGPPGSMSVRDDYLSPLSLQARTVLEVYGREWGMRDATCTLILLEALSDACDAALVAMGGKEVGGGRMFGGTVYQRRLLETIRFPIVVQLLERIHLAYVRNLQTYRDFYPRNQPRGAVETAILILRLIHKNTLFREESGVGRAEPDSFRTALRNIMTQASITRYGQLQELSAPLDRTDILQTLDSITEFVNLLKADIEEDSAHFDEGFMANKEDLKMSKLTSETYLKCLVLTLEDLSEVIAGEEVVKIPGVASKVFDVYMILRGLEEKYGKLVPSLKRTSVSGGFSLERWFHPFVQMWLKHLGTQTVIWVDNALRADDFSPLPGTEGDVLPYSSSIRDVYSAIYAELDVVLGLVGEDNNNNGKKGGNGRQGSAKFLQIFAKVVNQALEHYCDRIISSEAVAAKPGTVATTAQTVINAATGGKNSGGKDISMESCIKLCNLVYAMNRLEDLQKTMNVEAVSRRQEEFYRRTLAPMIRRYRAVSRYYPADEKYGSVKGEMKAEDDSGANMIPVRGAFKVEVVYAENVKGCKGNGMANPYVMVRVPEGSVMEREELMAGRDDDEDSEGASPSASTPEKREPAAKGKAVIKMVKKRLRGKECELLRTRPNYDTLNPTFDEAFDVMLPEVERLEVGVLSKVGVVEGVALSGDEVVGFGSVNLAGSMRSKLMDHQTHEVWVDLEPQGRVLLRITMEGDGETVEYWFKKTNRRFIRNRNDLVRSLAGRLVPYCRKVLLQVVKGEEQAPQKGFLKAIGATAAPVKLEDVDPDEITTAAGVPIDQDMTFREIAVVLKPMEDYLDKNFATICEWLTPTASVANSGKSLLLAQETIQRVWEELVEHCLKNMLVPPLYGQIEKDRKVLNKRQVSAVHSLLHRLRDFFYADGEGFGLPLKVLESPLTFGRLEAIVKSYYAGRPTSEMLPKVQKEYENSLLAERLGTKGSPKALKPGGTLGRGVAVGEKEYLLRIVRLRAERGEDLTDAERTEAKGWLDSQLVSRKKDTGAR
ncbi:hypothetical protein BJ742DRAFT_682975 [Cladochytrium replicatum]|nr:hypothetical protein BJ742DRAFT_682975 [Cladochytrium replicatum]